MMIRCLIVGLLVGIFSMLYCLNKNIEAMVDLEAKSYDRLVVLTNAAREYQEWLLRLVDPLYDYSM